MVIAVSWIALALALGSAVLLMVTDDLAPAAYATLGAALAAGLAAQTTSGWSAAAVAFLPLAAAGVIELAWSPRPRLPAHVLVAGRLPRTWFGVLSFASALLFAHWLAGPRTPWLGEGALATLALAGLARNFLSSVPAARHAGVALLVMPLAALWWCLHPGFQLPLAVIAAPVTLLGAARARLAWSLPRA